MKLKETAEEKDPKKKEWKKINKLTTNTKISWEKRNSKKPWDVNEFVVYKIRYFRYVNEKQNNNDINEKVKWNNIQWIFTCFDMSLNKIPQIMVACIVACDIFLFFVKLNRFTYALWFTVQFDLNISSLNSCGVKFL